MYCKTILLIIALTLVVSCATSSPVTNPVSPEVSVDSITPLDQTSHQLWGYYMIYVDPSKPFWQVLPFRDATFHLNVLKYLEQGPCYNCLSILGITPTPDGTKLIDVQLRHPFVSPNLTGFDVRGIAMFNGSVSFPSTGNTISNRFLGDGELVNADGFTSLYNSGTAGSGPGGLQGYFKGKFASLTPPDATISGFKRFVSPDISNIRNAFFSNTSITVTYEIDMPDTAFIFGYAIDANWAQPTVKPVTDPMTQFPPEANCPEPWKVVVTEELADEGMTEKGGVTKYTVDVYDWSGKDSHGLPFIECPGLFDSTKTVPWYADGADYTRYVLVFGNENLAGVGHYKVLVGVTDNEIQNAPEWLELRSFQVRDLEVKQSQPPVAKAKITDTNLRECALIGFADDGSEDLDGCCIELFEWDWNNDGVFDETGSSVAHTWNLAGTYYVQLRVTDDEGDTDMLDTPLEVVIGKAGWARTWGGPNSTDADVGNSVAADSSGNVYVVGDFNGTVDFDPGPGTDEHFSNGNLDAFLVKYDYCGEFVWALTWGGAGSEVPSGIALDQYGNPCVAGWFADTVDFDPGAGEDSHSSNGLSDAFVCKFDSDGLFQWAETWGGTSYDECKGLAVDGGGNVYVSGEFYDTADFDPTAAEDIHISQGSADAFLVKYHETGFYYWARTWGANYGDEATAVGVDGFGNVYTVGYFDGIVDFDPGHYQWRSSAGQNDAFLLVVDSSNSFIRALTWGSSFTEVANSVAVDGFGLTYVAGMFNSNHTDFDPSAGEDFHDSNGVFDSFLSSFDVDGNYRWTLTWGGSGNDRANAVSTNPNELVYVAGYYEDTVDFDPGAGTDEHSSHGMTDIYISEFDSTGAFHAAWSWGSTGGDQANGVSAGPGISMDGYATGFFQGVVNFDTGNGFDEHIASGAGDVFVTRSVAE